MAVTEGARAMMAPAAIEEFLRGTTLFRACDPGIVAKVAPHVEAVDLPAKATIIRAGGAAEHMCVLMKGKATVHSVNAATGASKSIESLQAGDHFAEVGPLLGTAHPYSITAEEPCTVLRIRTDIVEQLSAKVPAFGQAIAKRLAMRLVQLGVLALRPMAAEGGVDPRVSLAPPPVPSIPSRLPGEVIPFVEVADFELQHKVVSMVPDKIIQQHRLIPLALRGQTLTVGMVAPKSVAALAELKRILTTVQLEVVAISLDDFAQALVKLKLHVRQGDRGGMINPETIAYDVLDSEREADKAIRVMGDEVVRYANRIIAAGLERDASDIHIEPDAAGVRVRFRVNGVMQEWSELIPSSLSKGIVARLKVLSGLDITQRHLPQDGRIALTVARREIDLRISTIPASRGEKVVLRVCEAGGMMRALDQTFVEPGTLAAVRRSINRPAGAILVAGGTGSGKSATLYSLLNERRKVRPDSNVVMIEDPVEYRVPGITQVQVNTAVGLGFPQILRAILRQDPDVIAIGETRDPETAHLAMEAANTGHLVLTSMHANGAMAAIQRLITLGCASSMIAQGLSTVLAQRLVRRLCQACVRPEAPSPVLMESLAARGLLEKSPSAVIPRAPGCDECKMSGFAGRLAVVEALQITDEIRDALTIGQNLAEVEKLARQNKAFTSYGTYAAFLMMRKSISASDALMAIAE